MARKFSREYCILKFSERIIRYFNPLHSIQSFLNVEKGERRS